MRDLSIIVAFSWDHSIQSSTKEPATGVVHGEREREREREREGFEALIGAPKITRNKLEKKRQMERS